MARLQKHLLMLLEEFDALCREACARYSLVDKTLLYAEQAKPLNGCEVDVAMLYSDFKRMRCCFAETSPDDRIIESVEDNPLMPGWYFRYVDTSTTFYSFDYAHVRRAHGVGINIHILRKKDVTPQSLLFDFCERGMKSGIHYSYKRFQMERTFDPVALLAVKAGRKAIGESVFARRLNRAFEEIVLKDASHPSNLSMPEVRTRELPAGFLSSTKRITLEGARLEASQVGEEYLARRFGGVVPSHFVVFVADSVSHILRGELSAPVKRLQSMRLTAHDWQCANPSFRREDDANLGSLDCGYEDMRQSIDALAQDKAFWKARAIWLRNRVFSFGWRHYLQEKRWEALFLTMDRYHQWERYEPYKDAVGRLLDAGCYDILWLYLRSYRQLVEKYAQKGYPFVPSEWMWDLARFLYEVYGKRQFVARMDALKARDKLDPIAGAEAEHYLMTHVAEQDEPVIAVASAAYEAWGQDADVILFVDRANSTGDMEALLMHCVSAEDCEGYCFAFAVSTVYEASLLRERLGEQGNRVRFVIKGGIEFRDCMKRARIVFTTDFLPQGFIGEDGRRLVFIPAPDYAWDEGRRFRTLLRNYASAVGNADMLVLPDGRIEAAMIAHRSDGCVDKVHVLRCRYPRFDGLGGSSGDLPGATLVMGVMEESRWGKWGSFEDVREFVRIAAAEVDLLSEDILIRLPQTVYERLLRVDEPDSRIAGSYESLAKASRNARLLIVDAVADFAHALFEGMPVILVSKSERLVEAIQETIDAQGADFAHIVGSMSEALDLAKRLLAEDAVLPVREYDCGAAREIVTYALALLEGDWDSDSRVGSTALPDATLIEAPSDLLVLEWQDADEFHEFLHRAREIASTVVLLESRTYWLLDSDIEALQGSCTCYVPRGSIELNDQDDEQQVCEREWRQLLGDARFGVALVPSAATGVYEAFLRHCPALETVAYDSLHQLAGLLGASE